MGGGEIAAVITACSGLILGWLRIRHGESRQRQRVEILWEECKREQRRLKRDNAALRRRVEALEERLDRRPARRGR